MDVLPYGAPASVGSVKIIGRLAFLWRFGTISAEAERGRGAHVKLGQPSSIGSPTPELTDGVAIAGRRVLGRRLSGLVAGRRTRLSPRLATGRQWQAGRVARYACRRPAVPLEPRSPHPRIRAQG